VTAEQDARRTADGRALPSIVVRSPSTGDLADLAGLLGELGYPTSATAVGSRLDRLAREANVAVLVADRDGTAVGLATAHVLTVIHADEAVAMLTALIVAESHRGQGIGRNLVDAVETWAVRCDARRITVAAGLARSVAHAFYERLGYEHTARRYSKVFRDSQR
jgi:GNAT superfamily N-acetyltransferase